MNQMNRCASCGKLYPRHALTIFDGLPLCADCAESATAQCSRCGVRIWRDENAGDTCTTLCQDCYDRWYIHCPICGRVILEESIRFPGGDRNHPMCGDCHRKCRLHTIE